MAKVTGIPWCHHTWSPWWGCTKVSEGCRNCYAEKWDRRVGGDHWGPGKARRKFGDAHWANPIRWNREAYAAGERRRVFPSMCDPFDEAAPVSEWARFWRLIEATPFLDWLLLTKRIERVAPLCGDLKKWHPNVWIGTSIETQATADDRIPHLQGVSATVRFLSAEPLLERVTLDRFFGLEPGNAWAPCVCAEVDRDDRPCLTCTGRLALGAESGIDWVIAGGESGGGARACEVAWIRSLVRQCRAAGRAVFVKQVGARVIDRNDVGFEAETEVFADGPDAGQPTEPQAWPTPRAIEDDPNGFQEAYQGAPVRVRLHDHKGADMVEWPMDLRVQEFPVLTL